MLDFLRSMALQSEPKGWKALPDQFCSRVDQITFQTKHWRHMARVYVLSIRMGDVEQMGVEMYS